MSELKPVPDKYKPDPSWLEYQLHALRKLEKMQQDQNDLEPLNVEPSKVADPRLPFAAARDTNQRDLAYSDETRVAGLRWGDLKGLVMEEDYKSKKQFAGLREND